MKKFAMLQSVCAVTFLAAAVQMKAQAAPVVSPATQEAEKAQAAAPLVAPVFPKADSKNFTAPSPSIDEVNTFLKALWGYDENRVWQVLGIEKTTAPGVARVEVMIGEMGQARPGGTAIMFITPDGKHAITPPSDVIPFGPKPFADARKTLQDRATGPSEGAKSNDLMIVEFADLQCPHCRDAQEKMNSLMQDFPQAKVVFENFPLTTPHPYAFRAAAEGVCIRKAKGDTAFFQYAQQVYDKQAALTPQSAEAAFAAAATAVGADPTAMATCAATDAAKDAVNADVALAQELGVNETPTIFVNGHSLSLGQIPYEVLKHIVAFQAKQDGVNVQLQPTLTTLK